MDEKKFTKELAAWVKAHKKELSLAAIAKYLIKYGPN